MSKRLDLHYAHMMAPSILLYVDKYNVVFTSANCVCLMSAPVVINFDSSRKRCLQIRKRYNYIGIVM